MKKSRKQNAKAALEQNSTISVEDLKWHENLQKGIQRNSQIRTNKQKLKQQSKKSKKGKKAKQKDYQKKQKVKKGRVAMIRAALQSNSPVSDEDKNWYENNRLKLKSQKEICSHVQFFSLANAFPKFSSSSHNMRKVVSAQIYLTKRRKMEPPMS